MRLRPYFALGLLALAAGCSGSDNNSTTGSTGVDAGSSVGRTCSVDAECNGLRCDPIRRQCICASDSDCPAIGDGGPRYCSNYTGLCVDSVPGCVDDTSCTSDQFCNPQTRACESLRGFCETCTSDTECGTGNHCLEENDLQASFCSKACTAQADCPNGTTCTALDTNDSQCIPNAGSNCKTFTGCTPDNLGSCDTDAQCAQPDGGGDQVCDTGSGLCKARVQVCPLGTVCDPSVRVCVNSCSVDRDCADATLACVNHICQSLSVCASDSDCPTDKVCNVPPGASGGSCVPFCSSDTDCSVGEVCQPVIEPDGSSRQSCLPGCVHNSDCPANAICADPSTGLPFTPSGTALGQCSTTLSGAQACQITDACDTCQVCSSNTCQSATAEGYCHTCDQTNSTSCSAYDSSPGKGDSKCLSLAGMDQNGNVISSGPYACGVPCGTSNPSNPYCPKGFVCDAIADSSGGSGVFNCVPADFDCGLTSSTPKCQ